MGWWWIAISVLLAPEGVSEPECAGCHPAASAQHEQSRHRVAFTNALFAAEYGEHPKAWCVSCHAPQVVASERMTPPESAASGVTCSSCHVDAGRVVARARSRFSIHDTRVDPGFGRAQECARCHQFNFPVLEPETGALLKYTGEPMQNTVAEARALAQPRSDCVGCHLEAGGGHQFRGSHDPGMVARAAEISLCRDGSSIELTVRNRGAGHNLPTGGVHRFLSARVWRSSAPRDVVEMRLGRRFGHASGGQRATTSDTTIPAGGTRTMRFSLAALGGSPSEPLNFELRYHYSLEKTGTLADGTPATRLIERERLQPAALARCGPTHRNKTAL